MQVLAAASTLVFAVILLILYLLAARDLRRQRREARAERDLDIATQGQVEPFTWHSPDWDQQHAKLLLAMEAGDYQGHHNVSRLQLGRDDAANTNPRLAYHLVLTSCYRPHWYDIPTQGSVITCGPAVTSTSRITWIHRKSPGAWCRLPVQSLGHTE